MGIKGMKNKAKKAEEEVAEKGGSKIASRDSFVESINGRFKKGLLYRPGKDSGVRLIPRVSSGCLKIDVDTGGGWPLGRIVEIYGPESAGKTHLVNSTMAEITNKPKNNQVLLADEEGSFEEDWVAKTGVILSNVTVTKSDCAEESLDASELATQSGTFDCIAVDSVAALIPKDEADEEISKQFYALTARLVNKFCRKLYRALRIVSRDHGKLPLILIINQLRTKVGVVFGNPETTPGGNAVKFAASVRVELRRKEVLGEVVEGYWGQDVNYTIVKNKTAPPMRKGTYRMHVAGKYAGRIDNHHALLEYGIEMGKVIKTGAWYTGEWLDRKVQGDEKAANLLRSYSVDQLNKMVEEIEERFMAGKPLAFRFKERHLETTEAVKADVPVKHDKIKKDKKKKHKEKGKSGRK